MKKTLPTFVLGELWDRVLAILLPSQECFELFTPNDIADNLRQSLEAFGTLSCQSKRGIVSHIASA